MIEVAAAILLGFAAGALSGMFGVGGGIRRSRSSSD
jgi:uncharacterized membrane protein YfcA